MIHPGQRHRRRAFKKPSKTVYTRSGKLKVPKKAEKKSDTGKLAIGTQVHKAIEILSQLRVSIEERAILNRIKEIRASGRGKLTQKHLIQLKQIAKNHKIRL